MFRSYYKGNSLNFQPCPICHYISNLKPTIVKPNTMLVQFKFPNDSKNPLSGL